MKRADFILEIFHMAWEPSSPSSIRKDLSVVLCPGDHSSRKMKATWKELRREWPEQRMFGVKKKKYGPLREMERITLDLYN